MNTPLPYWQLVANDIERHGWSVDAVPAGGFRDPVSKHRVTATRGEFAFEIEHEDILTALLEIEKAIARHERAARPQSPVAGATNRAALWCL